MTHVPRITSSQVRANPARKRFRRRLRSKQKKIFRNRVKYAPNYVGERESVTKRGVLVRKGQHFVDVDVPEQLTLFRAYEETVAFLQEIRNLVLSQRRTVRLIFEKTQFIGPAALTCLLAEIYRAREIESRKAPVTGTYPLDKKLERMLQFTGFYSLLKIKPREPEAPRRYPMEYMKFQTGTRAIGKVAEDLEQSLFGAVRTITPTASAKLYRALTEAMTNVVQHAYPDQSKSVLPKLRNRWWLLGSVNKVRKDFTALLMDQGVGIPKTLPANFSIEAIQDALSMLRMVDPNDGEYIQAAMSLGKSKTREPHRGKGLQDLRGLIDQCGDGALRIFSRRGDYEYHADGREDVKNNRHSLGGTLIQWRIPLMAITNLDNLND